MPYFIKHSKILFNLFFCFYSLISQAQVRYEVLPPPHIKTVVFKSNLEDQIPIVKLGERITLTFDDLLANEGDYYYKIVHCNANWTPSNLLKPQYLKGIDNQRIIDHKNSYNTLVAYSHFNLTIPNEMVAPKLSGNYMLEVYNTLDELQFSRRFMVFEDLVTVQTALRRSRTFKFMNTKQVLQFSLNTQGINLNNPLKELKVVLIKNYQFKDAITGLQPQFNNGNTLVYDYNEESSFWGGNEYLNFDTKDIRAATAAVQQVNLNDIYEHYLYTNTPRNNKPYTFFPDLNGDFRVRTLQGQIQEREADYSWVHFSLAPFGMGNKETAIYILGRFNNYRISPSYKMNFDTQTNTYKAKVLFKQGFYNYSYALVNTDTSQTTTVDPYTIDGNFHFTENQYHVLVYFRGFKDLHERLVGIGTASSASIRD